MIGTDERVLLPIGVEVEGVRYREVIIDEMTGFDEENLSSKKVKNNGAKGITILLRRCIQEIPGVLAKKKNPLSLISEDIVRNMYVADRDFLTLCIRTLSDKSEFLTTISCPDCGHSYEELLDVQGMDVYEWDENVPVQINIELPRGFFNKEKGTYHNKLTWHFPRGRTQEKIATLPTNQIGTHMIAIGIGEVEGLESRPSPEEVRMLSIRDRNAFAQAIMDEGVGVETKLAVECNDCGHEFETEVDIMGFFSLAQQPTKKQFNGGKSGRRLRKKA